MRWRQLHEETDMLRLAISLTLLLCATAAGATGGIDATRRHELHNLLQHDCGACHGITRKGGIGPALTQERLAGMDSEALLQTILKGRPGTAMPPWENQLSRDEAQWLLDQLQRGIFTDE